jgi:hypothetical protein
MPFLSKEKYATLDDDESLNIEVRRGHSLLCRPYIFLLAVAATAILSGFITALIVRKASGLPMIHASLYAEHDFGLSTSTNQRYQYTCGNSSSEAMALGCTFDPLSVNWIPVECSREGTDEWLEFTKTRPNMKFPFFRNFEGSVDIPNERALSLSADFHTTKSWHLGHCIYLLQRLHVGYLTGARVDSDTANIIHTKHCLKMLMKVVMEDKDRDTIDTHGEVGFLMC